MADDPMGKQALQALGFERFVSIEDSAYNSVRELVKVVGALSP
jgi:hypothetical protein